MGAVHALVTSQQEDHSQSPEAKLAALVQAHPVFVLQFGLMLYIVLNFVLERYSPAFAHVMRVQALLCSFATNLLDCLLSMSVSGDVAFIVAPGNGTTTSGSGSTSSSEASSPTLRKMDLTSLPVNAEMLQRARGDMLALSQTRSGQQVAYALLALSCGAPRHSVLPVVMRGAAFLVRASVLLLVGLVPLPAGVLEAIGAHSEAEGGAKKKGKKGKKNKKNKAASGSGVDSTSPMRMLFPFPLAATAPSLHPETLDVLADMASFPVEFIVTRGWSKAAPKPKPGTAAAEAAAALPKPSTVQSIVQFLVMMVKGMVVMALLKVRLGRILDFVAPAAPAGVAVGDEALASANATSSSSSSSRSSSISSSSVEAEAPAPFFMSTWPLFRDPITRNVVSLVRQMLSPDGVTTIPGMGPRTEGAEAAEGAEGVLGEGTVEVAGASASGADGPAAVAEVEVPSAEPEAATSKPKVKVGGRKKGRSKGRKAAGGVAVAVGAAEAATPGATDSPDVASDASPP